MSKIANLSVMNQLKEWFERKQAAAKARGESYSYADLARDLGYAENSSLMSQYFAGKYAGDLVKLERRIVEFLRRESELQELIEWSSLEEERFRFVETSVFKRLNEAAKMCQLRGQIGRLTGESGRGKTRAVLEYARRDSGVIVIQAHKYFTAKEVFREIAYKCGIEPRGTIHTLMLGIVEKLKGTRRLIIIDEAEHLNANTLDEIRQLNDRAGVGVLYVGTEKFKSKITTLRGDYGYIVNRIKVPATLAPITVSDVKMLVETVIESPSEAVVNAFAKEAMGDVRLLENLVFKAIVAARHSGVSVNSTEFVKIIHDVADILLERGVAA